MMGINDDLDMGALQLVCGLVELGENFPDENNQNQAGLMVISNSALLSQVEELSNSPNNYISGMSFSIL